MESYKISAVKGMIVQVVENLINNSVYWLDQKRLRDASFKPKIDVVVDIDSMRLHFSDNGPGIQAADRHRIFEPFVTTKPPGMGKGLGLYVSREIALYHNLNLELDEVVDRRGRLHTFVLTLESQDA